MCYNNIVVGTRMVRVIKGGIFMRYPTLHTQNLIDNFFNDSRFSNFSYGSDIDIYREDDNYVIEVDLPGFDKEDIEIEFKKDVLTLRASFNESVEDTTDKNYVYRSRTTRNFFKQIRFEEVDGNDIDASYENGVLRVKLPVKVKEETVKRIEVR